MTDMERMYGSSPEEVSGTEEMDLLFRKTDFSAENPGLKIGRLWQKFQEKVAKRGRTTLDTADDERELTDGELGALAAAGQVAAAGIPEAHKKNVRD